MENIDLALVLSRRQSDGVVRRRRPREFPAIQIRHQVSAKSAEVVAVYDVAIAVLFTKFGQHLVRLLTLRCGAARPWVRLENLRRPDDALKRKICSAATIGGIGRDLRGGPGKLHIDGVPTGTVAEQMNRQFGLGKLRVDEGL